MSKWISPQIWSSLHGWRPRVAPVGDYMRHGFSCFASRRSSFDQLVRRCQRFKTLLKRLELPAASTFEVDGKLYSLPLRSREFAEAASRNNSQDDLDYCAGFFDGDGCVYSCRDFRTRALILQQVTRHGAVLLKLMKTFGGGIRKGAPAHGYCQSTLAWSVHGKAMQSAASKLSMASLCKREQLELVATEPPVCQSARSVQAARLRDLKREPPRHLQVITWAYLAGFFDAEGCIQVKAAGTQIGLTIGQKHQEVLMCVRSAIQRSFPDVAVYITRFNTGFYSLGIHKTSSARKVLERLLLAGLVVKKQQAMLALTLNEENHSSVREKISALKGNQKRTTRMDADGYKRACHIRRVAARMRCSTRAGDDIIAESLREELQSLKLTHEVRNLERSVSLLRRDIRSLLSQGATASTK